ncbi:MAG: spore maturation protein CgeB [Verrucomicrobiota bacterium]
MHVPEDFTREEGAARTEITQKILDEVQSAHRQSHIDLFLGYFYNAHFDAAGFEQLRTLGITSVNFYCNSIYQFPLVADIAANVDYSWHPEKNARALYLDVGAKPVWVQMGADPDVYRPIPEIPKKRNACFVGQRYADRDRWIASLISANIPLVVYGPGWGNSNNRADNHGQTSTQYLGRAHYSPGTIASYLENAQRLISQKGIISAITRLTRQTRYRQQTRQLSSLFSPYAKGLISFEEISRVFAAYEVCLNFSNVWADGRPGSTLISHVRLRDFEAPMCRTCYLTGESDEIRECYDVGKEIDTYSSKDELIDKVRFYLSHTEEAERLRERGYQRARRDHTWKSRFQELFDKIGITRAS